MDIDCGGSARQFVSVFVQRAGRQKPYGNVFAAGQYQKLVERYENMSLEQAQERLGTEFSNIRKYAKILKQENSQEETKEPVQNEMQNSQTAENAVQKQTSEELLSEVDEGSREMIAYHQSLTAQQQTQLELQLKQLRNKLEYLNGYEASIDTVMANAENMKRFRIFSKQNTFSYSNILRTAQDFERVQNVELKLDNDKGADAFVHYNLMYYIAAALMVAVIYSFLMNVKTECGRLYITLQTEELYLPSKTAVVSGRFLCDSLSFVRHDISYSDAVIRRSKGFGKSGTDLCGFWKIYIYTQ